MAVSSRKKKKKTRSASSILEELDRAVYEGRWQDLNLSLKKMGKKTAIPDTLTFFLKAIQSTENVTCGHTPLSKVADVHTAIDNALEKCGEEDTQIRIMLQVKKSQLHWLEGDIGQASKMMPPVTSLTVATAPLHTTKVLMEGNMYLALCSEALDEEDQHCKDTISAYEQSLLFAINIVKAAKTGSLPVHPAVYRAIRTALERGPVLAIKHGKAFQAVSLFRRVLEAKDEHVLPQIRQICTTSLACTLLFMNSQASYKPLKKSATVYTPASLPEEAALATILAKNFVGSISDTKPTDASVIFDLLTLSLTNAKLYGVLFQHLEDMAQFTVASTHMWLHFALALVTSNQFQQAEAIFHKCIKVFPLDLSVVVSATEFLLESMQKPELAVDWIESSLEKDTTKGHYLEPKLWFILGKAKVAIGEKVLTSDGRLEMHTKGLTCFKRAVDLDRNNVEFSFRLALQLAIARNLLAAKEEVQRALGLMSSHTASLHLLVLIFSAEKQYGESIKICDLALQQEPENLSILRAKIQLQLVAYGVHAALQTCKLALKVWQKLYGEEGLGLIGAITQDHMSLTDFPISSTEHLDTSHTVSPDVASDAGSSHISSSLHQSLSLPSMLQAQIWCTIAEVFMEGKKLVDASSCIREAQFLSPYLPIVFITQGKLLEREDQPDIALDQLNNALILQPSNPTALTHMGRLYHLRGEHRQAEKCLREATSVDRLSHEGWFWLGKAFAAQKEHDHAADCFKTALQLESTAPIQSFNTALHNQFN